MKQKTLALLTLGVIFGGIFLTMIVGAWTTENTKTPARYTTGSAEGEYNPEDIRGSYTLGEVSTLFDIPTEVLIKAFNLPLDTNPDTFKTKDLESLYSIEAEDIEVGNESVQVFVALYNDLPMVLTDTYLPTQAVELLLSLDRAWPKETIDYLKAHSVIVTISEDAESENDSALATNESKETEAESTETSNATNNLESTTTSTSQEATTAPKTEPKTEVTTEATTEHEEPLIKGTTTFQQLLDAGIEKAQIEAILGANMPPTNQLIKDYCVQNGLSFSEVKTAIEALSN